MLSSISYLAIFLCIFNQFLIDSFSTIKTNETDQLALLAIKAQLRDPLGVMSSWNISVPLCLWTGVSCSHRHQRVTGLDLRSHNIGGRLSPYIGNLSFLNSINLANNRFYGEIPHEVGHLFRLKTLILANNSFSGTIPTNLSHCSNLITFVASRNILVGEIPAEIGSLLNLEQLSINQNHLIGQVPVSIENLSVLQTINLNGNGLGGKIPDTLGKLKALLRVGLADNNLFGTVPASIYNISSLEYLYLAGNRLNGSLPFNIGFTLHNLKRFIIDQNDFTGSLPDSLSNASNLEMLDASENNFKGKLSIDFSGMNNLWTINLGENNLGTRTTNDLLFLNSLINCSKLEELGLYQNQFGGMLPPSIANLSNTITKIQLGSNQISGSIPLGIGNLVSLTAIGMQKNQISGTIPDVIGELRNLQVLYLYENELHGSIPSSLGNLTLLNRLALQTNELQGIIPSSLGNCQTMIQLLLNRNKLSGTIPPEIFGITTLSIGLDLSENLLGGPFPLEVGNLKNLVLLDISKNMFFGEIPSTLGGCPCLEYLSLQGNSFSGSIPSSLASLKSIEYLDLSSNNLSTQIPKYLENLSFLEALNLSYNEFEGEVPTKGVFSNTSKFSLVGNIRLCGGVAELHLPPCHFKVLKKSKLLFKVVIPVIASVLILFSACFVIVITRTRKSGQKSSSLSNGEDTFPMISYAELSKATNEFSSSNVIGQGSFGLVYKGMLGEDSKLVAVKIINLQQKGASKSFMAECGALRNIRHRNLTKIITVCSSIDNKGDDFKALVYEYMQNGSLEEWLHHHRDQLNSGKLSFLQRLEISIDVASAIEYLHHYCQPPIIHGDLKPSNVLLDHDMVAHVGDFGLAKFLLKQPLTTTYGTQSSSMGVKGTVGYVPPEYGMGSEVAMPGDVYSFGILLLEMFTGRKPTDSMFNDGLTLHEHVKMALPERMTEIVEPCLVKEVRAGNDNTESFALRGEGRGRIEECLVAVLRIGVVCSMDSPTERMKMSDVVVKLCAVREKFLGSRI